MCKMTLLPLHNSDEHVTAVRPSKVSSEFVYFLPWAGASERETATVVLLQGYRCDTIFAPCVL